jgi:hypothetical protein
MLKYINLVQYTHQLTMYRMNTFGLIVLNQNAKFVEESLGCKTLTSILKYPLIMQLTNPWLNVQPASKFKCVRRVLFDNPFLSHEARVDALRFFGVAQKTYHAFSSLACIVKRKKARVFEHNMDLLMNPLSETRPSHRMTIYENSTAYEFKLGDLATMANKRLSHSPSFFADPQPLSNPYTNIPFSLPNLYRIYFRIRETCVAFPVLFHRFFLAGFDLDRFMAENEVEIREVAIKDFCANATPKQKQRKLSAMLYLNRRLAGQDSRLLGSPETMNKVKHLLPHYLAYRYSLNPTRRFRAERIIATELQHLKLVPIPASPFEPEPVPQVRRVRRRLHAELDDADSEEELNLVVESVEHAQLLESDSEPLVDEDPDLEEIIAIDERSEETDSLSDAVSESDY